MKTIMKITYPALALFAFACIALVPAPKALGVVPPPSCGHPEFNTAVGQNALFRIFYPGVGYNTAVGFNALRNIYTGGQNTAIGANALRFNTSSGNTAVGFEALTANTIGYSNTATGFQALYKNNEGFGNTAIGKFALMRNTGGGDNAAVGDDALGGNIDGGGNTAVGHQALAGNTTGNMNTALGYSAGFNVTDAHNVICVGSLGRNVSSSTWIGNIYGITPQSGTTAPVIVSNNGQLGTVASSERFKKDIASMQKTSEAILALRPVTFHYKTDAANTPQFGLIAEEVAKINAALVLPDKEGKPYTVRYDAVNAMLLNEFLKEHKAFVEEQRKVEKLEATVAQQHKDFEAAVTDLKGQIQKVSAPLELNKPAPQTVLNNQ